MNPYIESVQAMADYKLQVQFENGKSRIFDVTPFLDKGIFVELKNVNYFQQVSVAFGSVEWPNDQDLSNDTIYTIGKSWI